MRTSELQFEFPNELVATAPQHPPRVMVVRNSNPQEISWDDFLGTLSARDLIVFNDTKVIPRRLFGTIEKSQATFEVLFVEEVGPNLWTVMCPASRLKAQDEILFPEGLRGKIVERGRIQKMQLNFEGDRRLDTEYFETHGEIPLPPYIQKERGERHARAQDRQWYQTLWAKNKGSSAAPTASLHFQDADLKRLVAQGVSLQYLTLHVGLGTYLPVTTQDLRDHHMHSEYVEIPPKTWRAIEAHRAGGGRVWALGTTTLRALESVACGKLQPSSEGGFYGATNLLILPGFQFQVVDNLITNFHQPESTLLALVSAFTMRDVVLACYAWAIERRFRLFSYGDVTVWEKK